MYNIVHIEGGIGKNIMGTALLRNINESFPKNKMIVIAPYLEPFVHNPRIYRFFRLGNTPYFYDDYVKNKNNNIFKLDPYNSPGYILKNEHLVESWGKIFNLDIKNVIPEIYFNKMEDYDLLWLKQKLNLQKPYIIVQTNGGAGYGTNHVNFHWYRDIPAYYYQKIIDEYKNDFQFVQIKTQNQMPLNNVIIPDLPLRDLLNLMRNSHGAICIDSLVQHVMAAFNKKSLVCWIGTTPKVFGYNLHVNMQSNFVFENENFEAYMDVNNLNSEGYQCPSNYVPETLFDSKKIIENFEKIFMNK